MMRMIKMIKKCGNLRADNNGIPMALKIMDIFIITKISGSDND